jgi:hypothetical protein
MIFSTIMKKTKDKTIVSQWGRNQLISLRKSCLLKNHQDLVLINKLNWFLRRADLLCRSLAILLYLLFILGLKDLHQSNHLQVLLIMSKETRSTETENICFLIERVLEEEFSQKLQGIFLGLKEILLDLEVICKLLNLVIMEMPSFTKH